MDFKTIGIIHSPYKTKENTPRNNNNDSVGEIEIFEEFLDGIEGLEKFKKIWIIFHFHKSDITRLKVNRFSDDEHVGVFASRAPLRPNKIGLSNVEILEIKNNRIKFKGLDMIDGTPVIDIKPDERKR